MRIVCVDTTNDAPEVGGGHLFLPDFTSELATRGHDVHLVTKGRPHPIIEERLDSTLVMVHEHPWGKAGLVEDITPIFANWLKQLSPDVYLISGSFDIGWTVLPMLDPNIATLTIGHNDQETFYAPVRHYGKFLTRVIGVSTEICRKYREILGDNRIRPRGRFTTPPLRGTPPLEGGELVEWIPYGVEVLPESPARVSEESGPLKLIYVGRLDEPQKRISDVVTLVKRLGEKGIEFTFDIVGDGDERAMVERELAESIADGRVRIHGWLASTEVIAAMRNADAFILASAYEGFCISLTEAMANGCCPVVTDIESGNKQLVEDGVNGFIVPVGDIDAFVDRIGVLAADRARLLQMRQAAWETGRKYSIERMVDNYVRCFEAAVEDARKNPRTPEPDFPLMESCRSKYPLWLRRLKAKAKNLATN